MFNAGPVKPTGVSRRTRSTEVSASNACTRSGLSTLHGWDSGIAHSASSKAMSSSGSGSARTQNTIISCARCEPSRRTPGFTRRPSAAGDPGRQPAQMRRVPVRFSRVANVVAQQERLQPLFAPSEVHHRVLPPAAQIPHRLVLDPRHVDRLQVATAQQPRQGHRVASIRLHPIAGLPRDERRRHDRARQALPPQVSIQPVPARTGLVREHRSRALRDQLANQLVDIALARPDRAQTDDLAAPLFRGVGDGNRVLVDIEPDVQLLARLLQG
jgi:hypothetical protein